MALKDWILEYDGKDSDGYSVISYDRKDKAGFLMIVENPLARGGWGYTYIHRGDIKKSFDKKFKTKSKALASAKEFMKK